MITNSNLPIIAIIVPFIATFLIGLLSNKKINIKRYTAIMACFISFITTLFMINDVFLEKKILIYWMGGFKPINGEAIGISLNVDAFSLFIAIIITLACFISSIYSFNYMERDSELSKYYMLFMLLTGSMIGFVFTGDLFNMYVMLEIMTIAAISLTIFRNNKDKSVEAGFKYIVTGGLGSSFILLGTVLIYMETHTLSLSEISKKISIENLGNNKVYILALAFLIVGYAVKSFIVPCHTWPTDAHMAAPSSISMLLSGVMSKTGIYGLIRIIFIIFPIVGNINIAYLFIILGLISMIAGVSMAFMQSDFKRLLAFHSVSQIGYIVIGIGLALLGNNLIYDLGLLAALFHMLNHAVFKCLLFLVAGAILYKTGTTNLDEVSGAGKEMPFTMFAFIIGALSISGIPPFNGFSSKWLFYMASFKVRMPIITVLCLVVSCMTLASFIKVFHTVFTGKQSDNLKNKGDIPLLMKISLGILSILCIAIGLFPNAVSNIFLKPVLNSIRLNDSLLYYESPYNPVAFFLLFIVITLALILFLNSKSLFYKGYDKLNSNSKYEVFTGGELDYNSKLSSHDIFWGMKYNFKFYFEKLIKLHNGSVNDYAFWIVLTLSSVILYFFMFI